MKKSFYHLYMNTQAGGGFVEIDFNTTSIPNLKKFVEYAILSAPYYCFYYGVFASLSIVENGKLLSKFNLLSNSTIKIEGLKAIFKYRKKTNSKVEYDKSQDDYQFYPWEGIYYKEINEEQKLFLKEFVKGHQTNKPNPKINLSINWERVTQIKGEFLAQGDVLDEDMTEELDSGLPVQLGSVLTKESELEILERIK